MGHGGIFVDNAGNIYVSSYNSVIKWEPGTSNLVSVIGDYYYGSRVRLDSKGNIYTIIGWGGVLYKYNILFNSC